MKFETLFKFVIGTFITYILSMWVLFFIGDFINSTDNYSVGSAIPFLKGLIPEDYELIGRILFDMIDFWYEVAKLLILHAQGEINLNEM